MEAIVSIGGVEKKFKATGATPIKYRRAFKGADFFRDLSNLKSLSEDNLRDEEIEIVEKIAYAMCTDSLVAGMTFENWVDQFDLFDLVRAIPEVINLITGNMETQNIAEKNGDRAEN